jgi:hypothetical protein
MHIVVLIRSSKVKTGKRALAANDFDGNKTGNEVQDLMG